ncbi:ATP-binding protein [Aeromonas simiae]|uniref:ATP-binding protein n=1 Tax=Aeromonas simiae TaxID=218936 RepID=UPI0005A65E70|nr:transporter substrate-binding domain-containing protein [Aeromonas simiae]
MTILKVVYAASMLLVATMAVSIERERETGLMGILSRESLPDTPRQVPTLSESQRHWLNNKQRLVLAVPRPDSPPMDITLRSCAYEGVTADIIGIVGKSLGVEILAKTFPSRDEAIAAIHRGEADFIGSANNYEVREGLTLTLPYIMDEPAIYKNFSVHPEQIKRVAVAESYLPLAEVISYLPGVRVELYPSRYSAMAAAAYGKVDAVLIDMISGNFLTNKFYQDSIQLVRPIYADTQGFSFGVRAGNDTLREILNASLASVSDMHVNSVIKRWSGGGLSIQSTRTNLTRQEWQWINAKGTITIAVNKGLPPLSFIDVKGNLHGIAADLFQVIGSKLGVAVEALPVANTHEQIEAVAQGRADAMILTPTPERLQQYVFSRVFTLDPLVYVVNNKNRGVDPEAVLKIGRMASIKGFASSSEIDKVFTVRRQLHFDRIDAALECVAKERCDVAILPLRVAKFFINTEFPDRLHIAGELFGSVPLGAGFAALPAQKSLVDILDTVVASIPPDELEGLATRWRVSAKQELITWQDVLREFGVFFLAAFLLFAGGLLWSLSLRQQIQRRKEAQAALGYQLKFIEELVDSTPHPIYACDLSGQLILCNGNYAHFLGMEKEEMQRLSLTEVERRWPFMAPLIRAFDQIRQDEAAREGDYRIHLPDGGEIDIFHWLQVYRDLSGQVQGVVGGWIDVSERVSLMSELASASLDAQEASRAKSTFLATMSHEIRTPMNAIIGLLELTLRKGALSQEDHSSVSVAYQSAHDLLGLIGDILDISKIESGKLELAPAPHRATELSQSAINVFMASARQKGLTLVMKAQGDHTVMIDPTRFKQVLSNLVSNAIKFTRKGGVELRLTQRKDGLWCHIEVEVTDSGIGISPQDQARLFQPFTQGTQPADEQHSGTGLGLMISRTLCQMMGGDLSLSSEPGQGTTVLASLRLPLVESLPGANAPTVADNQSGRSRQVLIIDDHPANRLLVGQQLAFLGHQVTEVASGAQALQCLAEQRFDIIITDFNMPDVNGLEFAARYRQQEREERRERSTIIGLTADARQEQIQRAIEAGMDDCLFKPISLDELRACLARHDAGQRYADPADVADSIQRTLGSLTAGNSDLMRSLMIEFIREADKDLRALAKASSENNSHAFLAHLHRLKGGARIIGANELVAGCGEWEVSPRLPWCMPSVLRQVEQLYRQVQDGMLYWLENNCVKAE